VFSNEQNDSCHSPNHKFDRVVIGAGALGLFLSSVIQNEFPNSNLTIISKSLPNQPVFIQNIQNESKETDFPEFFLIDNIDLNYPKLTKENITFYICIPPELVNLSFQYINDLLLNLSGRKNIYLVFLSNGIIDYKLFYKLKNTFIKNKKFFFFLIRAIVISGLMRTKLPDKIIIKNTSGNKIYYGFLQNSLPMKSRFILPMGYFEWIYTKKIFAMEKAKFLVNFILGLCIGNKEIPNSNIFIILSEEKRKEIFLNYCSLFPGDEITPLYLENYFNDTIKNTSSNINSVSLSWHHGNKKPIEYFVANIEKMAYLSNNKEVHCFFKNLINIYS
jgi:hypothetical protein